MLSLYFDRSSLSSSSSSFGISPPYFSVLPSILVAMVKPSGGKTTFFCKRVNDFIKYNKWRFVIPQELSTLVHTSQANRNRNRDPFFNHSVHVYYFEEKNFVWPWSMLVKVLAEPFVNGISRFTWHIPSVIRLTRTSRAQGPPTGNATLHCISTLSTYRKRRWWSTAYSSARLGIV